MVNLGAFIRFHASRTPDRPAILYDGQRITYGELYRRMLAVAALLAGRGVGPETVVAVLMKNSAAFIEIALATSHLGAVLLPINYRLAAAEVDYFLDNSGARLVLADGEFAAVVANAPDAILLDQAVQADGRRLGGDPAAAPAPAERRPDDLFRLVYTSGTTDRPKGVMHSYDNFYWKVLDHVMALGLGAHDRLLVVGPLYHVGAFDLPGTTVLWTGGALCIHREFEPRAALAAIAEHRLTGGWMAPTMLNAILGLKDAADYDLASFKWLIGGGERTPESRIRQFGALFTAGRYIDAYGLTESCSGDTLMEAGREIEKIGSTGRALAHVAVEIRDDDGRPLPPGTDGEICLSGPKITRGYWRDPEKTRASFHGPWLRTGDVGHLDGDGFLYLTDRKKDMIISGGENIASSEVERVIFELPEVSEAAVIGLADERWGERPVAVVVPRPGASLDLATLERHCRARLAGFKVPKELHLMAELPRNPSGKVLKRVLREALRRDRE